MWVNPRGYPATYLQFLKVTDSFLGGFEAYDIIPESRDCMANLTANVDRINSTLMTWNFTNTKIQHIYENCSFDECLYNLTQSVSQFMAPSVDFCVGSAFDGGYMFYRKQLQFTSVSYYMMSLFQNFMGKVITISKYYERYLQSMQVNDVD